MPATTTPSGLIINDTVLGTGKAATAGEDVSVHYTGWLFYGGERGKKFDSSKDRGEPFQFGLGGGQVIKGWDEGVEGMKVGGRRRIVIPPGKAYGRQGAGGVIGPDETLVFVVDLFGVG